MFLRKTYVDMANIFNDFNSKLSHEYHISIPIEKLLQNALENNLSLIGTFFFSLCSWISANQELGINQLLHHFIQYKSGSFYML